ncbi:MAG: hypothetical protein RJA07_1798 [Bacteroidota bacterium]|jgi:hypothetical protein
MEFFKKDKAWFGFLLGLLFPILGFIFFTEFNEFIKGRWLPSYSGFSVRLIFIVSVMCNLLPFSVARKNRLDFQMQGIVGATLLCGILFMAYMLLPHHFFNV